MYRADYNSGFEPDSTQTEKKTERTHRDHTDSAMEPLPEAHGLSTNRGSLSSLRKNSEGRDSGEEQILAEPGRHSCGAQASQEDPKQEHDKTLDEITLDLSGIPLTLKMGNPLTRDPSSF